MLIPRNEGQKPRLGDPQGRGRTKGERAADRMARSGLRPGSKGPTRRRVPQTHALPGRPEFHSPNRIHGLGVPEGGGGASTIGISKERQFHGRTPQVDRSSSNGDVTVTHTEFICPVIVPTGVASQFYCAASLNLNPGLPETFPWLANLAGAFEMYKFHSLNAHYLTREGTTQSGSVMMAYDYDSLDPPPISEQQLGNYQGVREFVVWDNASLRASPVALSGGMTRKFVRLNDLDAEQDLKMSDSGQLFVVVPDAGNYLNDEVIGKLWLTYKVTLYTPHIVDPTDVIYLRCKSLLRPEVVTPDIYDLAAQFKNPISSATFTRSGGLVVDTFNDFDTILPADYSSNCTIQHTGTYLVQVTAQVWAGSPGTFTGPVPLYFLDEGLTPVALTPRSSHVTQHTFDATFVVEITRAGLKQGVQFKMYDAGFGTAHISYLLHEAATLTISPFNITDPLLALEQARAEARQAKLRRNEDRLLKDFDVRRPESSPKRDQNAPLSPIPELGAMGEEPVILQRPPNRVALVPAALQGTTLR